MKPSSEYRVTRPATKEDFALFIAALLQLPRSEREILRQPMAKPPFAHRSDIAKFFAQPITYVPVENQFMYYATVYAEARIKAFLHEYETIKPEYCQHELDEMEWREAQTAKMRRVNKKLLIKIKNGYFIGKPATLNDNPTSLYGEFVLYKQWLQDQIKPPTPPHVEPKAEQPAVTRVPHFTAEAKQAIVAALQPFLSKDDAERLPEVWNGSTANKRLLFKGTASQLIDLLYKRHWQSDRKGCNQTEFWQWLHTSFLFLDKGQPKEISKNTFDQAVKRDCKNPI